MQECFDTLKLPKTAAYLAPGPETASTTHGDFDNDELITGSDSQAIQQSEMLRRAVVQKLGDIGEAAARVSADLASRHHEVPWPQIAAIRNILIHAYSGFDWDLVWRAATNRCPVSRGQIADILAARLGVQGGSSAE